MVWISEINNFLVTRLRETITVTNEYSEPSPVFVSYSEPEGEDEGDINVVLPRITVRVSDIRLDKQRNTLTQGLEKRYTETNDMITLQPYPIPHWLFYEINVYTEFQFDIVSIMTQIQSLFPPRGAIHVPDGKTGELVPLYMEQVEFVVPMRKELRKTQTEERRERFFKSCALYKITAELDINLLKDYYKVKEVKFNVNDVIFDISEF